MVVIEMNPRVSRVERAREQGHGVPDRQDRREARGRLPPRRGPQRHHRGDAGVASSPPSTTSSPRSRAGRSRSCPGADAGAGHDDAVGRRGDGDRPDVPGVAAEGAALAGDGPRPGSTAIPPSASTTRTTPTSWCAWSPARRRNDRSSLVAALRRGVSVERLHEITGIDPWFLDQMAQIVEADASSRRAGSRRASTGASGGGSSGSASPTPSSRTCGDERRRGAATHASAAGVGVTYKTVDTCAAEFAASTPYHYGTYEDDERGRAAAAEPAVVILGSGPNRIGQGVEFDYCCVHAAFAPVRCRLRDGDGQLQPGDRLDRLRHERPPVLRAALGRGRARRLPRASRHGRRRGWRAA